MARTRLRKRKTNPFLKFLTYFWGPIPWMIEAAVILSGVVRHWPDFFIILVLACFQRRGRILGRTSGGQRHRRAEGQAGDQGQGETRWEVDRPDGARAGAGRRHPPAPGRHCAGGCALAGGRSGGGGSVRVDGRIFARHAQTGRGGVFGVDHPPGRNRRDGLRHRHEHLLRQDRATGAGGAHRQPFPACRAEDWRLPDRPRGGSGGVDYYRRALPWRPDPHHVGVLPWCFWWPRFPWRCPRCCP